MTPGALRATLRPGLFVERDETSIFSGSLGHIIPDGCFLADKKLSNLEIVWNWIEK